MKESKIVEYLTEMPMTYEIMVKANNIEDLIKNLEQKLKWAQIELKAQKAMPHSKGK